MALFKVDFTAEGRMQYVFVEGASEDAARMAVEEFAVEVTGIRQVEDSGWYQSDSESLMVEAGQPGAQDGFDVEYGFLGHSQSDCALYGSDSARTLLEDAGVSEGYRQVADKARGEIAPKGEHGDPLLEEPADGVTLVVSRDVADTIRLALDGEHSRLIYLRDKSHSRLAMRALRDEIDAVGTALSAIEGALADEADFR